MDTQIVREISEHIESIPSLPTAAMRLIELTDDPGAELSEVSRIISADQGLAVRVLQVANSAFYGAQRKIGSINQAVVTIGFQAVKNITLSLSVMTNSRMQAKLSAGNLEFFWRQSLATAIVARRLAVSLGIKNPDEAFTAGLIHDIGVVILMNRYEELYARTVENARKRNAPLLQMEQEVFEMNHAELGAELCRHWRLPQTIISAVATHHDFNSENTDAKSLYSLAGVISVADEVTKIALSDGSPKGGANASIDPICVDLITKAQYPTRKLHPILMELTRELKQIERFFGLPASPEVETTRFEHQRIGLLITGKREKEIVVLILLSLNLKYMDIGFAGEVDPRFVTVIDDAALRKIGCTNDVFAVGAFKGWIHDELFKAK